MLDLEKLAAGLWDIIREEGKEALKEETDEWKEFSKEIAKDMAKKLITIKTGNESEVAVAKEDLDLIRLSIASRLASSQLDLLDNGAAILEKLIRVVSKVALSALLA